MNAQEIGRLGERFAVQEYQKDGFVLLAANFMVRGGEIDAVLQRGDLLVFLEVKTRSEDSIALPREWVNTAKQKKLVAAAREFLRQNPEQAELFIRFDVAEVFLDKTKNARINRIENAFTL